MAAPQAAQRYKKLQAHYSLLSSRAGAGDSLIPDTAYADFLKAHEYGNLPNMVPETSEFPRIPGPPKQGTNPRPPSANTIRKHAQKSLDESSQRLKAIEDYMWQHRQEERDLKRAEMDLIKQKKQVQRSIKQYESKISQQQSEEDRLLHGKEQALEQYRQQDLHRHKDEIKNKTQASLVGRQKLNESTKKYIKTENELSWRYRNLLESLEQKRGEVEKLSKDFQDKIRAKEEEQFRMKKELADLAITLNMEAHKTRQTEAENNKQFARTSKKDIQGSIAQEENMKTEEKSKTQAGHRFENNRRNLHHSLKEKQEMAAAKQRQSGRNLQDVRTRMQHNGEMQRLIAKEAEHVELDMIGQEMNTKTQLVDSRKQVLNEASQRRRVEKNTRELKEWEQRYSTLENESRRKGHEDRLKRLSRAVTHFDQLEQDMYLKAKSAEAEKKKHDQSLMKMQNDLNYLKRENARRLKAAALEAEKAEQELQHKIVRENSDLFKATSMREKALQDLTTHRIRAQEERRMLSEEKRELERRTRIQNRSAFLTQST